MYYSDLISVRVARVGSGHGGGLKVEGPGKSCATINTVLIYTHIYIYILYSYSLIYWLILITYSNNFSNMYSARNYQRHPTAWEVSRPWDKWKKPETWGEHFDSFRFKWCLPKYSPWPWATECLLLSAMRLGSITASIVNATCQEVIQSNEHYTDLHSHKQLQAATISYTFQVSDSFRCLKKSSWTPLESLWPAFRAPCVLGVSLGDSWSLTSPMLLRCPCSTIS